VCFPGFERVTDHCVPMPSSEPVPGGTPGADDEPKSPPDSHFRGVCVPAGETGLVSASPRVPFVSGGSGRPG
jgi:hypothetical protein